MTEITARHSALRIHLSRTDAPARSDRMAVAVRATRTLLPMWLPRRILQRGGIPTREDQRAMRDLRAAQDRSDWC